MFALFDMKTYLPDNLLVKTDRTSMAYGLEVRAPFLDPHVARESWRIPLVAKIKGGWHYQGKRILRRILAKYLPRESVFRAKRGFGVPLKRYLTGPLYQWRKDLLSHENIARVGYFDHERVSALEKDFEIGRVPADALWNVCCAVAFLQTYRDE